MAEEIKVTTKKMKKFNEFISMLKDSKIIVENLKIMRKTSFPTWKTTF